MLLILFQTAQNIAFSQVHATSHPLRLFRYLYCPSTVVLKSSYNWEIPKTNVDGPNFWRGRSDTPIAHSVGKNIRKLEGAQSMSLGFNGAEAVSRPTFIRILSLARGV